MTFSLYSPEKIYSSQVEAIKIHTEKAFPEIKGNFYPKLGLLLNLIEPACGGIFIVGKRGTGKTALLQDFKRLCLRMNKPFLEVSATHSKEALLGFPDFEQILRKGTSSYCQGLLERALGKFLIIDDFHLLEPEIQKILIHNNHKYVLIATLSSDENLNQWSLDKIGLFSQTQEFTEKDKRKELLILKIISERTWNLPSGFHQALDPEYFNLLKETQRQLHRLTVDEKAISKIVDRINELGIPSHRAEVTLYYALRALSALLLSKRLVLELLPLLEPLVFSHRLTIERGTLKEGDRDVEKEGLIIRKDGVMWSDKEGAKGLDRNRASQDSVEKGKEEEVSVPLDMLEDCISRRSREEVFPIRRVGDLSYVLREVKAEHSGLRKEIRVNFEGKSRSGVRESLKKVFRVKFDILGTLIRASLFQPIRGGWKEGEVVKIYREDLVYRRVPQNLSALYLFVVDASGSLGASKRMGFVKGAVASLFEEAYRKRDQVAVIVFREFSAELLLAPTRSSHIALEKIRETITGGYTPLSAGLQKALILSQSFRQKHRFNPIYLILLTDGRANISIKKGEDPFEEALKICYSLTRISNLYSVVIDSESTESEIRFGLARELARALSARYYSLDEAIWSSLGKTGKSFKIIATL